MSADDESQDETSRGYARLSAMQAGRPAASTRAAILAEARKVADARRAPAANEPWFRPRVSASIAASILLAGVAMLLWRQVGPQQVLQTKAELTAAAESAATDAGEFPTEEAEVSAPAAAPPTTEALAARAEMTDSAQQAAKATSEETREFAANRSASAARAAAPAAARAAPTPALLDVEALIRREFPDLLNAAVPPRSVWVVQDASGRTLRSGTLAEGESFGSVTLQLQQEFPDRRMGPFEVSNISSAQGAAVQVGVARAR
jgi:hypothetical protein